MERREALAVAAAVVLHAGLFAARPKASLGGASAVREVTDIIELHEPPPAPAPPVVAPPSEVEAPAAGGLAEAAKEAAPRDIPAPANAKSTPAAEPLPAEPRVQAPAEPAARVEPAPRGDTPPAGTAPPSDLSQPPPPVAGGALGLPPGLGGTPAWAVPGVLGPLNGPLPAPTAAPAARPVDRNIASKVIDGTLRKRDADLGLDAPGAGVVASTLADAVRSAAVPGDARATFEVRIGAAGDVQGVRLVSATAGDGPAWDRVVKSAKGSLAGRALRAGDGKAGATVLVKIESKVQYPAGSKVKVDTEPVCLNDVVDQITAALQDPGSIGAGPPMAGAHGASLGAGFTPPAGYEWDEGRKKFCIPVGIRGRGDLSNIGAHAQTVVRSSFSVKRDGERALPAEDILPIDTRVPWAKEDPTLRKPPPAKKKKKGPPRK